MEGIYQPQCLYVLLDHDASSKSESISVTVVHKVHCLVLDQMTFNSSCMNHVTELQTRFCTTSWYIYSTEKHDTDLVSVN